VTNIKSYLEQFDFHIIGFYCIVLREVNHIKIPS